MRSCLVRAVKFGLLFLALLLAVSVLTHQGRTALKSAGLFVEVFPSSPVYPLRWFTPDPSLTEVRYPVGDSEVVADLYRPGGSDRHGAMVLYIGVGPERRNRHVVRLAQGLARAGIVVLVPGSKNLSEFRVVPEETEGVVAAFAYMRSRPYVDPERIGIMGISAGGSLVAIAAQDPRISDDVRLIELFGSYYSAFDMLSTLTLRRIEVDGVWREWQPEDVSVEVFRDMLLDRLPPADRPLLTPLFNTRTTAVPDGLSPPGRAVAELLVNRDPAQVQPLTDALPAEIRAFLAAISPATEMDRLRTEVFLLHDRDDQIIPFTQSRRFFHEATNTRDKHLTELRLFRHVEPSAGSPIALVREGAKLYAHLYSILLRLG